MKLPQTAVGVEATNRPVAITHTQHTRAGETAAHSADGVRAVVAHTRYILSKVFSPDRLATGLVQHQIPTPVLRCSARPDLAWQHHRSVEEARGFVCLRE